MNVGDSLTSAPLLSRLIEGLAPPLEFQEMAGNPAVLPAAEPMNWVGAGAVGALGIGLLIWSALKWKRRREIRALWPALSQMQTPDGDREKAQAELTLLEFLVSLSDERARRRAALWHALTPSERTVALATLRDEPMPDLAQRLACTPSHVYNLRASIRKKWDLDPDLPLRVAISQQLEGGEALGLPADETIENTP